MTELQSLAVKAPLWLEEFRSSVDNLASEFANGYYKDGLYSVGASMTEEHKAQYK
jgi:hypothetical protein